MDTEEKVTNSGKFAGLKEAGQKLLTLVNGDDKRDVANIRETGEKLWEECQDYLSEVESGIERGYLQDIGDLMDFEMKNQAIPKITWLQLLRLPVHPANEAYYDLMTHWQNVLSTFNVWGNKFVFLLLRMDGETNIFFGVIVDSKGMTSKQAIRQIRQATSAAIPGIEVADLDEHQVLEKITDRLLEFDTVGTITGMPSLRESNQSNDMQTLDALAFGFKGEMNDFTDYATLVIAEPIAEPEINDIITSVRDFANDVHTMVRISASRGHSQTGNGALHIGSHDGPVSGNVGGSLNKSQNLSIDLVNKHAEYVEAALDNYAERLRKGRNLGFWNAGVYVLARTQNDAKTVLGILKSIYSGDNSYIEPIRANVLNSEVALRTVRRFELLPYPFKDGTHPFGKYFESISTPMNTEELSIATSLPRKDVPGIRFSKTAVRFATNPAEIDGEDTIEIGNIMDIGVEQNKTYQMNPNALVRHALVAGCTGSGKSTTCKKFLSEINKRRIPSLIIEPAKDDYVRWAIAYNRKIDEDETLTEEEKEWEKYDIYMPGVNELDGYRIKKLKLNPFEPAAIKGAPIDLTSRYEQVVTIINASVPSSDVLPVLIDETIYRYMLQSFGEDFRKSESEQRMEYPKISNILEVARAVLEERHYDKKVQNDIAAALDTRFNYLSRGKRGEILDVRKSVDYDRLFNHKCVINLSRMIGTKDKSLIMSFVIVALYEYRNSAFSFDLQYRARANENKLLHLTLIEEAHNLLQNPEMDIGGSGNPQKVSAEMFTNILSEIRSYGQGLIIVDQVPTRLIPDAIKNTNYKIIHRLTAADDAAAVAASMALSEEQVGIISKLKIGETIVCGDLDDAALWVKVKQSV